MLSPLPLFLWTTALVLLVGNLARRSAKLLPHMPLLAAVYFRTRYWFLDAFGFASICLYNCLNLSGFRSSWGGHHNITFELHASARNVMTTSSRLRKKNIEGPQIFKRNLGSGGSVTFLPSQWVLPQSNAPVCENLAFATIHSWDASLKDVPSPWTPWIRNGSSEDKRTSNLWTASFGKGETCMK